MKEMLSLRDKNKTNQWQWWEPMYWRKRDIKKSSEALGVWVRVFNCQGDSYRRWQLMFWTLYSLTFRIHSYKVRKSWQGTSLWDLYEFEKKKKAPLCVGHIPPWALEVLYMTSKIQRKQHCFEHTRSQMYFKLLCEWWICMNLNANSTALLNLGK